MKFLGKQNLSSELDKNCYTQPKTTLPQFEHTSLPHLPQKKQMLWQL